MHAPTTDASRSLELSFDRGTLLIAGPSAEELGPALPGVVWDPRVNAFRAPAFRYAEVAGVLGEKGVETHDRVAAERAARTPPSQAGSLSEPGLRPYQRLALDAWEQERRRGIVVLPTGSGKTRLALAAIARGGGRALCLVPTRVLLAQWREEIARIYSGPIGLLGDGSRTVGPITVSTFASAIRAMSAIGARFELLVVDEVHHFGRGQLDEALEMCAAPHRLGLTATPPEDERADMLSALLGPIVERLSIGDLVGTYLADFDLVVLRLPLEADERAAYVREIGAYRAVFNVLRQEAPTATWQELVAVASRTAEGRAAVAAARAARRIANYTRAKARSVATLLARHRGSKLIVFTASNETAYAIAREHLVMPITCDIGRKERSRALQDFRDGRLDVLVSARVLNEGLDVPDADVAIVVGGTLGEREHVQRIGRLLRPRQGKRAVVYELVTTGSTEMLQSARRRRGFSPWELAPGRTRPAPSRGLAG